MAIIFNCKKCGEKIIVSQLKPGEISKCKMCGSENIVPDNELKKDLNKNPNSKSTASRNEKIPSFGKFPALMTISGVLKFAAYVELLISIGLLIFGLTLLDGYDKSIAIIMIASSIIFGFVGFIAILAYSELIKVFLEIEKNTRD